MSQHIKPSCIGRWRSWSQNRGAYLIFEFAWHVSTFVEVMVPRSERFPCVWPPYSIRGMVSCLTCGTCGCTLPVNPSGAGYATSLGKRLLSCQAALCLVNLGLFGLYISSVIMYFCYIVVRE